MGFEQIVQWVLGFLPDAWHWLSNVLGVLVVCGYAIVKLSPSQEDDAFLVKLESVPLVGALLRVLVSFSPVQRK